jgi:hypothetical protein
MMSGSSAINSLADRCLIFGVIERSPTKIDSDIAAFGPPELLKSAAEGGYVSLKFRIVLSMRHQYADPPHPAGLLRMCGQRPCRRSPEQRDKLATLQSVELHLLPLSQGDSIADWRASSQGLAAVREFCAAEVSSGVNRAGFGMSALGPLYPQLLPCRCDARIDAMPNTCRHVAVRRMAEECRFARSRHKPTRRIFLDSR